MRFKGKCLLENMRNMAWLVFRDVMIYIQRTLGRWELTHSYPELTSGCCKQSLIPIVFIQKQNRRGKFIWKSTRAGTLTYYTEGFPCKAQSSLPSSVSTAAPSRPDTNNKFQTKDNNHDKFLERGMRKMPVTDNQHLNIRKLTTTVYV